MIKSENGLRTRSLDGFEVVIEPLPQADVNQIMELVNSISGSVGQHDGLWNIVCEGASDYFSNRTTVQDAVRVIQSRASTYISEQS